MQNSMRKLSEIVDLKGKRVLMRVDFNVPVSGGVVTDGFRIEKTLPTIRYVRELGAEVVLISHFEDEEGSDFKVVADYVDQYVPIKYCTEYEKSAIDSAMENSESKIVLLSNLRDNKGEKANSKPFSKKLASFGDLYVNEAFSSSHREHASIVGVPSILVGYMGLVFESEVRELSKAFEPGAKSLFILGGAKFDTKMPLVEKFVNKYTNIFIGGALANTIFKSNGIEIGKSAHDKGAFSLPKKEFGEFVLPIDFVVEEKNGERVNKIIGDVEKTDTIFDAGDKTVDGLIDLIVAADFVLWNGPLGFYEKGFKEPTLKIARAIAESNAKSILGGGDTIAVIKELGILDAFDHVSTGGGAMLDFLAKGTLPGLEALK